MPSPVTPKFLSPPGLGGKWPARRLWVSAVLLAGGYVTTIAAVALKSDANWPAALLLVLATFSTLAALARQLPAQNALLAALLIALIGGVAHAAGFKAGIPFGSFMFGPEIGWSFFGILPWVMPLIWVVAVLNARGVARLVLRPWRKIRTYGFWLIGLTALFTVIFDIALDPLAAHVKHYWLWTPGGISLTPQGAPISNSVGWFLVTLLMLAFVTPILINKQLSKRSAPDFHPLAVWFGGILLFATAAALNGLWPAVAVDAVLGIATTVFAIRGARW